MKTSPFFNYLILSLTLLIGVETASADRAHTHVAKYNVMIGEYADPARKCTSYSISKYDGSYTINTIVSKVKNARVVIDLYFGNSDQNLYQYIAPNLPRNWVLIMKQHDGGHTYRSPSGWTPYNSIRICTEINDNQCNMCEVKATVSVDIF